MKASFISEISEAIHLYKKAMKDGESFWNKLKDLPGIAYIEEVTNSTITLQSNPYSGVTLLISQECNLDLVCSVVGEIEEELDLESVTEVDSYMDEVKYNFRHKGGRLAYFKIRVARPKCRWVTLSEKVEYYKEGEVKDRNVVKTVVCD